MNTAKLWIGLFITIALYWSCSKNGSSGTPSISFKSVNQTTVAYDTTSSLLTFTLNVTEASYNPNDTLFVIVHRYPDVTYNSCDTNVNILPFNMVTAAQGVPSTTGSNFSATMQVTFTNGNYFIADGYPDIEDNNPCTVQGVIIQDTAKFSFVLGSSGHYSDTVKVAQPIILLHS